MFGWKSKAKDRKKAGTANGGSAENTQKAVDARLHNEGLGHVWHALTGQDPAAIMPQIVATVLAQGGTRPAWQWKSGGQERILMAWPKDQPIRAAVLMAGPENGQLKPVTAVPLLEGFPNDLAIEETHARGEGLGGDVAVSMLEDQKPMWFFDPLFDRDRADLTPGVTQTFWLGALALGIRKALLDEVSITQGQDYEEYADEWLKNNPGKSRLDVPPLKMEIRGKHFIMPGRAFGEYQLRALVEKVEDWQLDKMPVKALYLAFPFDKRPSMRLPLFAPQCVLGGYEPEEGQEIEAYAWFQGRIIDLEEPGDGEQTEA